VCKETIVVVPVLVALHDRVFVFGSWAEAVRARRRLYLGLAASWLVLAGLVSAGPRAAVSGLDAGVSVWSYLLNQSVIIVEYLRLTVWPSSLVVFYGWPEMLSLGEVLPQALVVVALLALTALALAKGPDLGYLGAWVFVTLAPTSSIVPIATEVGAERRMYLPLMALAVLAAVALHAVAARLPGSRRLMRGAAAAAVAVAVIALGSVTVRRNAEYASAITLAQTVVDRRPTAVAHHILGEQFGLAGRRAEAEASLRTAVSLGNSRARYQLAALLIDMQRQPEAAEQLEAFIASAGVRHQVRWLDPPLIDVLTARLMLARIRAGDARWDDVAAQARAILAVVPRHPEAQRLLGAAFFGTQQWPDAIVILGEYLTTRPNDVRARADLGVALVGAGRLDDAIAEFRRATGTDPNDAEARRLLELALADRAALGR
jgi:tetratricopeptide (TPR) repeat protein